MSATQDRARYAAAKRAALQAAVALGEDVDGYDERESRTLCEIYARPCCSRVPLNPT